MKKILALAMASMLFSLPYAATAQDDFDLGLENPPAALVQPVAKPVAEPVVDGSSEIKASVEAREASSSMNEFAIKIFGRVAKPGQNVFLSPYSIDIAFCMAMAGASDYTLEEFLAVLHPGGGEEKATKNIAELFSFINSIQARGDITLAAANAIWPDKTFKLLPTFAELLKKVYQVEVQSFDYAAAKAEAVTAINKWVEEKTFGKIAGPVSEDMLDEKTAMLLVNAIYFKGNWASQFDKTNTRPADFHIAAGNKVKVNMMNQTEEFRFLERPEFKAIELPYQGNDLTMLVLLPSDSTSIENFEETLTPALLAEVDAGMHKEKVVLGLPAFKLATSFSLNLAMKELGLTRAFSAQAEFGRMSAEKGLFISWAIHKAFVDVNEEGTEAAAITMMGVEREAFEKPAEFIANRPFVFIIREVQTGCILFIGRLFNPPAV